MHLTRLVIELDLPEQLHVLDIGGRQRFFILLPGGPLRVTAIGQPVRGFILLGQRAWVPHNHASNQQQQWSTNCCKPSKSHFEYSFLTWLSKGKSHEYRTLLYLNF